jgi:uncharacterized protein YkwD
MIILDPNPPIFTTRSVYIPYVSDSDSIRTCFGHDSIYSFYNVLRSHEKQKRRVIKCHPTLVEVARKRARQICDVFDHITQDGVTVNELIRLHGLTLPDEYSEVGNNVECIAGGSSSPQAIVDALANSPNHSVSIFGLNDFFEKQNYCGIGFYSGGEYSWYWSIIFTELITSGE